MSVWNGKLISEMDLSHIHNTMKMLEKRAKSTCNKNGGSDWKLYVDTAYFDLEQEYNSRDHNF